MTRKKIKFIEGQGQIFDSDSPLPPTDLVAWGEYMKTQSTDAQLAGIPLSEVEIRQEKLLRAIDLFAQISGLRGLDKIANDPEYTSALEDRTASYPGKVFKSHIVPNSDRKWRRNSKQELNGLVTDLVGDVDSARESSWGDFTAAEQGELGIHEDNMDAEELQANLRAKFATPDGAANRTRYRKLLGADQRKAPKKKAA